MMKSEVRKASGVTASKVLAHLFRYSGLSALFFFLNRNRKRIITYHHVLPDEIFSSRPIDGVSHRRSCFDAQLAYIAAHFSVGTDLNDRRELAITFDDGYLGQQLIAAPVMKKYGVSAIYFCSLNLVTSREVPLLVDDLLFWVSFVNFGVYEVGFQAVGDALRLEIMTDADRAVCWEKIYEWLLADGFKHAHLLREELDRCVSFAKIREMVDGAYYSLRCMPISDEGLAEIRKSGHLVGAHAASHVPLTSLSDPDLEGEISACAEQIGRVFNTRIFSYPFGGVDEVSPREVACVSDNGFTHGLANINAPLPRNYSYGRYFVPRMSLPDTSCPVEIEFVLSGAKYFLQHRRLLPSW